MRYTTSPAPNDGGYEDEDRSGGAGVRSERQSDAGGANDPQPTHVAGDPVDRRQWRPQHPGSQRKTRSPAQDRVRNGANKGEAYAWCRETW